MTDQTSAELTVSLVQMTSSDVIADNIAVAEKFIRQAATDGADVVMTPEMTTILDYSRKTLLPKIFGPEDNPHIQHFSGLAKELDIWLLIGSMPILDGEKIANRSHFFDPEGQLVSQYDKIHMFDVDLPNGEQYRESRSYSAGDQAVITKTPWGKVGLSICYDVRFPYLYRDLAKAGVSMLTVPAAFTKVTGEAHWHTLLKARAIENGCFVFAPAQVGRHANGRDTFGHALIIDPWGNILGDAGAEPGIVTAKIDLDLVKQAREKIPSLGHDRLYQI